MTAILDLSSYTSGGLRLPNLTTTQRDNIVSPQQGLVIWNTTDKKVQVYDGTTWQDASAGA